MKTGTFPCAVTRAPSIVAKLWCRGRGANRQTQTIFEPGLLATRCEIAGDRPLFHLRGELCDAFPRAKLCQVIERELHELR